MYRRKAAVVFSPIEGAQSTRADEQPVATAVQAGEVIDDVREVLNSVDATTSSSHIAPDVEAIGWLGDIYIGRLHPKTAEGALW